MVAPTALNRSTSPGPLTRKRVFVIDDHPIVRQGLSQLIANETDLEVCGQAEGVTDGLSGIEQSDPDILLLDISLKDGDGLEVLKKLRQRHPDLPVLMLSMHDESLYAERVLRLGAKGYVMKQEAPQVLLNAIHKVLDGHVHVSEKMSETLVHRVAGTLRKTNDLPMDRLTDRELEIFRLIGAGRSVREIAAMLFLSLKTVEAHREHLKRKLNLRTSAELFRFAIQNSPDGQ